MKFSERFAAGAATLALFTLPAVFLHGETVQSSGTWTLTPAGNVRQKSPGTATDSDAPATTVSLPKFDSALGTLQSATITFATVQSLNDIRLTGTRSSISAVSINQNLSWLLASPAHSAGISQTISDTTILDVFSAPQGRAAIAGIVFNDTHTFLSAEQLTPFTGIGTFLVSISTANSYSITTNNSTDDRMDVDGTISGTVGVTYNYSVAAIPEPAAFLPAIIGGLCAAGVARARRSRPKA